RWFRGVLGRSTVRRQLVGGPSAIEGRGIPACQRLRLRCRSARWFAGVVGR
ncbi:unnamed protein product, partial [Symbiodinium pilosum]